MFNMVIEHFAISETEGHMLDLRDLLALSMVNDDLGYVLQEWDNTLGRTKSVPEDAYLRDMFEKQIEYHPRLKEQPARLFLLPTEHPERQYLELRRVCKRIISYRRRRDTRAQMH